MEDEIIIDATSFDNERLYAEVGSDGETVRLYVEDDEDCVELKLTPGEALALIGGLSRALIVATA
jgi:hypothetical protein